MTVRSSAGTTIKISASQPSTYDGTGYAALTMTTIGEVTTSANSVASFSRP